MARYIGPKSKIARRFGEPIFGADKVLSKRNFPPGQHGNNRRRKMSEYGVMLAEKQLLGAGCCIGQHTEDGTLAVRGREAES